MPHSRRSHMGQQLHLSEDSRHRDRAVSLHGLPLHSRLTDPYSHYSFLQGEKVLQKKKHDTAEKELLSLIRTSAFCGFINVSGSVMVQFGLIYTNASKAGF